MENIPQVFGISSQTSPAVEFSLPLQEEFLPRSLITHVADKIKRKKKGIKNVFRDSLEIWCSAE